MSTFDTMQDWREGMLSNTEALLDCLCNLAVWCPVAAEQEAFEALGEIILFMRKQEDEVVSTPLLWPYRKDYHAYLAQVDNKCLASVMYAYGDMPPNYPMPATISEVIIDRKCVEWLGCENNYDSIGRAWPV